ncbi:hypothetical protein Tco_1167420 [Tanacetum coccineum]
MESLNSKEREMHQLQQMQDKAKESCMISFRLLHSHLKALSNNDLKGTRIEGCFERAFMALFDQDVQTFTGSMLLNLNQLEHQLDKEEFQETGSMDAFRVLKKQFQRFINFRYYFVDDEGLIIRKFFLACTQIEVRQFRDILIQHIEFVKKSIDERAMHTREYDNRVNERQMQSKEGKGDSSKTLDANLVVTESNETELERHVSSSRSGKDTHTEDANINSVNDKQPMAEVDRNTTPDSTDMSHRGGEIDQNAKKCQVSCPLLDPSFDNMTTKFSNQFLESKNISLKKTVAQLQKDFSRMETHCVNMELKYQNQVLKNGQHGQILNETSNEANIKREINVLETRNIDLESSVARLLAENENSVARLLAENEKLNKENEHLKQTYKDLSDSIKKTSVQTKDHVDSLVVQLNCKSVENADLKAQIQEKVFANTALKNELRKIKGTSVDTKISKPRFASQVDVKYDLPKSVTPYYLPIVRDPVLEKLHHMIAPGSSRNSSKESYASNDMTHKYYLEEAKKKTQERDRKSTTSVMPFAKSQNTTKSCKSKPRGNNQTSRFLPTSKSSCPTTTAMPKADHSRKSSPFSDFKHFVCSTCQKCVFNANHDACITKFLKEVNSRVKVQSPKTRNSKKLIEPKIHTQKPGRQIVIEHRFSPNKSFAVHEKTNTPRSCLRWIPTGRIFNTVGLRWVPTGKTFTSSTTKVDCEPPNGLNEDITNPYECDQTLNVSAGTLNLSAGTSFNPKKERLRVWLLKKLMSKNQVPQGIHKQKQSPNSSQGVNEQQKRAHFDDPCHELLHRVYISQGSSSNVHK